MKLTRGSKPVARLLAGAFLFGLSACDSPSALDGSSFEVTIRRSKTDQEGEGHKLGVPFGSTPATCPVRTVLAWKAGRPPPASRPGRCSALSKEV